MREGFKRIVHGALGDIEKTLGRDLYDAVIVENPRKPEFGDFSTNIAMVLSKELKSNPRQIAEGIIEKIKADENVKSVDVAGPGFINVFVNENFWPNLLKDLIETGFNKEALSDMGKGKKVQVEFVSANPTGPLHIGHGRGAAVGATLTNILRCAGYDVTAEYYINDVGNQMNTLGASLYYRYKELLGEKIDFPDDHYKGDYMVQVAEDFKKEFGDDYKEKTLDESLEVFRNYAKDNILETIKNDLKDFNIVFDNWYSEKQLHNSVDGKSAIEKVIEELKTKDVLYEEEGALWFRTTEYGDDKDRVVIKADGSKTYFAADLAYHKEKFDRGFDKIVDVWGADHHGYEARIRALLQSLDIDEKSLSVIFIQLVSLLKGGESVSMSTRAGQFITLREVLDEVGSDACRWFFLMRKHDSQLEFDVDLAKKEASENPVYYVQYSHARICSIEAKAETEGFKIDYDDYSVLANLKEKESIDLIKQLALFREVIERSAENLEPHKITYYLSDLAAGFHSFYTKNRVVGVEKDIMAARLILCRAVKETVKRGLAILGVSAPEKM